MAEPNQMQYTFKHSQTQLNAVRIEARPNPTECSADSSTAKPNRMRCAFECGQTQLNAAHIRAWLNPTNAVAFKHGQTQPNAVQIRARPNPTECSADSSAAKPNQMQCAFERSQTQLNVVQIRARPNTNHYGQHKLVQKWVCKPAFIIWLVPGVLPSKWDNGTSHAIFRFHLRQMGCPISEMHGTSHAKNHNSWDVPSWMGHPPKKHPP
ncbi:hypothetical protein K438DRAFT_1771758 [Mycena galopus ATCC 62051]|nr:hypothetical protein K438DRAFT_1771758 [Mycena galopus ATCC 62051]